MKNIRATLLASTALLLIVSSAAHSADAYKGGVSTKDAPYVSPEDYRSWGGLYIGLGGGGSFGVIDALRSTTHGVDVLEYDTNETRDDRTDDTIEKSTRVITDRERKSLDLGLQGLFGEAELGYGFQAGRFVFGPRATIGISKAKGEASYDRNLTISNIPNYETTDPDDVYPDYGLARETGSLEIERKWDWSAGGTLGYLATPDTMIYGVLAYTQAKINIKGNGQVSLLQAHESATFPQFPGTSFNDSETVDGVVLGAGIKTRLRKDSNWLLGVEYTYTKFDDIQLGDGGTLNYQGPCPEDGIALSSRDDLKASLDAHAVKATLTYQFGNFGR